METKAINWERGSVYINKSYSMKGADPNSGRHKLRSPQEQYMKFKCLLQPRLSLVLHVIWTKPARIFWLEAIPGSHHWVRSPYACSGESTFAVPLPGSAFYQHAPKLLCCPNQHWSSGDDQGMHFQTALLLQTKAQMETVRWREELPKHRKFPRQGAVEALWL